MGRDTETKLSTIFDRLKMWGIFALIVVFALCVSGCTEDSVSEYNPDAGLPPQHSLTWSPDGSMLAYIFDTFVAIHDAETDEIRQLTGTGFYYEPTWSPDSIKVAYSSSGYRVKDDIYIKSADGSDIAMRLTWHVAPDYRPRWSPDGTKIAFYSRRTGSLDIWIKNADGSGEAISLAPDPGSDLNPEWSPDSTKLVFESKRADNFDIWVVNIDGIDPPVQITSDEAQDSKPMWSPDGTRIAFQSDRSGNQGIWVKNADGTGDAIELSAGHPGASMHKWSTDSARIAFVADEIILVSSSDASGVAEKIADGVELCWSPDGTRMAIVALAEERHRVQIIDLPE